MNKICVLGSINMDLMINVNDMPKIGETILAKGFKKIAGGKGANQAIAAVRSGANVSMIGKIGTDDNGSVLKKLLENDNIDTKMVYESLDNTTGIAMIMVNNKSDNSIVVIPGANMEIQREQIDEGLKLLEKSDILIAQFETQVEIIEYAFMLIKKMENKITILNPAPAKNISDELLKFTDILIPNETEIEVLTNRKVTDLSSAKEAGQMLINKGIKIVIITLGAKGAALISKEKAELIEGYKVKAIDTTAAGDSFIGALSSKINIKNLSFENLKAAVKFAHKVASIAVQREGAQPSIPTLEEVDKKY
ncbi:MAG: ribokinase [Sarcina sp.]